LYHRKKTTTKENELDVYLDKEGNVVEKNVIPILIDIDNILNYACS